MSSSTKYSDTRAEIEKDWAQHNPVRRRFERLVFCNGCFDILHPGHIRLLSHARQVAGPLGIVVAGINSDSSVKRLKGEDRPVFDEDTRALMLSSMKYVDYVVVFEEDTPLELITALRPDIVMKGSDYAVKDVVSDGKSVVLTVPLDKGWSTSNIVRWIKKT